MSDGVEPDDAAGGNEPARPARKMAMVAVALAAATLGACGGGGDPANAEQAASCLEGAELSDVDQRDVSDAEDIDVLGDAAADADGFVSATDSADRDVYVLVYESEADAGSAAEKITAGDQEVGVRGDNLLVFSQKIGPENRVAIEECFLDAGEGDSGEGDGEDQGSES